MWHFTNSATIVTSLDDSDHRSYVYLGSHFATNPVWESEWSDDLELETHFNMSLALHKADTLEVAKRLIEEEGFYINDQTPATKSTPLVIAIKKQRTIVAQFLLESKCDPNIPTSLGESPLQFTVMTNNEDLLLALLKCGANPLTVNISGETILHKSVKENRNKP